MAEDINGIDKFTESLRDCETRVERLSGILELSKLINSTLDLDELLRLTMELTAVAVKAEASSLMLKDKYTGDLMARVTTGEKGEIVRDVRIPREKGIAGWVAENGKPLLIKDVNNDPRFFKDIDKKTEFETRGILCVPLLVKGNLIGVVEAINKRDGDCFDGDDMKILEIFASQVAIAIENTRLHCKLHNLLINMVGALSSTVDTKNLPGHSGRVMKYSLTIAEEMNLDKQEKENLRLSALLHDIGIVRIEDRILSKDSFLTDEEFLEFKRHPEYGANIIRHIEELEPVVQGIWHHHEHYDGNGYPGGLAGKDIPLIARIIALAEDFDTMRSNPLFHERFGIRATLVELEDSVGSRYDPEVFRAFKKVYEEGKIREAEIQAQEILGDL